MNERHTHRNVLVFSATNTKVSSRFL